MIPRSFHPIPGGRPLTLSESLRLLSIDDFRVLLAMTVTFDVSPNAVSVYSSYGLAWPLCSSLTG